MASAHSDPSLQLFVLSWNITGYAPSHMFLFKILMVIQQAGLDTQTIELLAPRIKVVSESLCAPIPLGDIDEKERGEKLKR